MIYPFFNFQSLAGLGISSPFASLSVNSANNLVPMAARSPGTKSMPRNDRQSNFVAQEKKPKPKKQSGKMVMLPFLRLT
jgi:hypothetical protein